MFWSSVCIAKVYVMSSDRMQPGANYGTGKRSGGASTFICGIIDDRGGTTDDDGELK